MSYIRQAGFSAVEGIVVLLVVVGVAGAGYVAVSRSSDKSATSNTAVTTTETEKPIEEAPEIEQTSDLAKASDTLDSAELDASDSELDAELSGF